MKQETGTKGIENGRGAYIDYGTRKVPDDDFNGLNIGYGWRKHWTVLCHDCLTASPYVISLEDVTTPEDEENGYVRNEWTLECPKCHTQFIWDDEYYED